jgi:hypothetical protein
MNERLIDQDQPQSDITGTTELKIAALAESICYDMDSTQLVRLILTN